MGYEVTANFHCKNITNNGTFYTDSNSLSMTKRILNHRDTYKITNMEYLSQNVSFNYYPVTSAISIFDVNTSKQMTVMNDRSQGGSSLKNGSVELMMTRRMNTMDGYGIHEILNELDMQDKPYYSSGIKTRWTYF